MKKGKVYVYQDMDYGDVEVFDSLEKAKAHAVEKRGEGRNWEEGIDSWHDKDSDYIHINCCEIK